MRNILLLGADPMTVSLFRSHFERAGVALASAEIVEPIGDFIRLAQPAAVLLDLTQCNGEGEELLRGIHADPDFRNLPLFALTDKEGGTTAGGIRIFQKQPALIPEVVKAIKGALHGSALSMAIPETSNPAPAPAADEKKAETPESHASTASEEVLTILKQLSDSFEAFCSSSDGERGAQLAPMQEHVRSLRRGFLSSGSLVLTAFASALARLLITLSKDSSRINPSSLRTLSEAVDALVLAASAAPQKAIETGPVRVLVVDDEALSRRAVQFALGCPDLELADSDNVDRALEWVRGDDFDVIFTEIKMLRMGDFSSRLRQTPHGADIRLVVVTALPESDARVQAALKSGCEIITKPFTPSEMVVKAFTLALNRRGGAKAAPTAPEPVPLSVAPPPISFSGRIPGRESMPGLNDRSLRNGASSDATPSPRMSVAASSEAPEGEAALRASLDAVAKANELELKLQQAQVQLTAKDLKISQDASQRDGALSRMEALAKTYEEREKQLQERDQEILQLKTANERLAAAAQAARRVSDLEPHLQQEVKLRQALETKLKALEKQTEGLDESLAQQRAECERLKTENIAMRTNEESLKNQVQEREGTVTELRESLARTVTQHQQESARRSSAEDQVNSLTQRQRALEQESTQRRRADEQARAAISAESDRLKAQLQAVAGEKAELQAKLNALPMGDSSGSSSQGEGALQRKMDDMAAYDIVTGELSRVRAQLAEERSQRQRLQSELGELEDVKQELAKKLETLAQAERARQQSTHSMESKLQETLAKLGAMETTLQSQSRESRRLQLRSKELEEQLADLSSQVTTQAVIEQSRRRREAELEACIVEQQAQIANTKSTLAAEGAAMQRTRERIHFALCRVIQELNSDKASLAPTEINSPQVSRESDSSPESHSTDEADEPARAA